MAAMISHSGKTIPVKIFCQEIRAIIFSREKMGQLSEKYVRWARIEAIALAGLSITMINYQDYDDRDEFGSYSGLQVTA